MVIIRPRSLQCNLLDLNLNLEFEMYDWITTTTKQQKAKVNGLKYDFQFHHFFGTSYVYYLFEFAGESTSCLASVVIYGLSSPEKRSITQ